MAKTLTKMQKAAFLAWETRRSRILKAKRVAAAHKAWRTIRAKKSQKVAKSA